jgi:hypothetical protein
MPHILVRDFSAKQKSDVEKAARELNPRKSTSKFCRDAAVLAAGGKLEDEDGAPAAKSAPKAPAAPRHAVKKVAAKAPAKKVAASKPKAPAKSKSFFDKIPTKKQPDLTQPQFRDRKKGKL